MSSRLHTQPFDQERLYELIGAYWGDSSVESGATELAIALMDSSADIGETRRFLKEAIGYCGGGADDCVAILQRAGLTDVSTPAQAATELQVRLDAFERALARHSPGDSR
jgi:hypothetical protein